MLTQFFLTAEFLERSLLSRSNLCLIIISELLQGSIYWPMIYPWIGLAPDSWHYVLLKTIDNSGSSHNFRLSKDTSLHRPLDEKWQILTFKLRDPASIPIEQIKSWPLFVDKSPRSNCLFVNKKGDLLWFVDDLMSTQLILQQKMLVVPLGRQTRLPVAAASWAASNGKSISLCSTFSRIFDMKPR